MLGLDWSELALIAVVAVVVIGPKDLPDAVRSIAKGIQKLRRMAGEFQGQVDEVVREAKLDDVRNSINEIRNFNVRGMVEKEIDRDGSLRKTFTEDPIGNPLRDTFQPRGSAVHGAEVTPPPPVAEARSGDQPAAPAFIPPGIAAQSAAPASWAAPEAPPSFVPPTSQQVEREAASLPLPAAAPEPVPAAPPPADGPAGDRADSKSGSPASSAS